ncbi:Na+/H+ antiporter subunit E [Georgenia sp. 10Sc9-8]|uniref:Na+/H+ antiporter subunit E n=1 Tax=Georgenia halotolerans TaxID=3028317 RepID=A0ABT5U1X2_9MICO|nr:Na+/H+ antiporter subunit E [Georgenia halotolerans]
MLIRVWDTAALVVTVAVGAVVDGVGLMRGILTPRHRFTSSVLELPLRCRSPREIGVFSTLIGVSPTAITVVVGAEPPRLFVYAVDAPDRAPLIAKLRGLETRVLRVTRGRDDVEGES